MRYLLILLLTTLCVPANGQLFRRSTGKPITSYTARDGVIVSAQCSCKMCDDARAAAATGATSFISGGRRYPIKQTFTAKTTQQAARPLPSLLTYQQAYAEHAAGKPLLVLVGTTGCLPCQDMKGLLQRMKRDGQLAGTAVCYMDASHPDAATVRRTRSFPELVFYAGGMRRHLVGIQPVSAIRKLIKVIPQNYKIEVKPQELNSLNPVNVGHTLRSTPASAIALAVALARVQPGDHVAEPGCGTADFLRAAMDAGASSGIGIEFNKSTAADAMRACADYDGVQIVAGDMFAADYRGADVVFLYHHGPVLADLGRLLKRQLRRGSRVVSYAHDIPGQCTTRHVVGDAELFLWVVGSGDEPEPRQVSIFEG